MRSPRWTSKALGRVGVDEQHLELVAVAAVDEPRRVEAGDAVPQRQAAAGLHEPGVALGDGDRDARSGTRARPPAGASVTRLAGHAGRGRRRPGLAYAGSGQVGVEADDGDDEAVRHGATVDGCHTATGSLRRCSSGWTSR